MSRKKYYRGYEKNKEYDKRYQEKRKQSPQQYAKYLEYQKEWRKKNPRNHWKKLRFEVLRRDAFTCQYCGRKAPDVVLHIDHIKPKSRGGENRKNNLITACADCNLGKSDVLL